MSRPSLLDGSALKEWINSHDTFLFDCDGVLWQGPQVIPGVVDVLAALRKLGKKLVFVSNNSTSSRSDYLKKFQVLGIEAHIDEIFGSSYAAAVYLSKIIKLPKDKQVFIIGMKGLQDELHEEGVAWVGGQNQGLEIESLSHVGSIVPDPKIGAVLFGMDVNISYSKIARAFTYLRSNPDCHFLATNTDLTYPSNNDVYPGTGALLAALTTPLQRDPVVLGKPHKPMLDAIIAKLHLDPKRTAIIGDRLDTDIAFGKCNGLSTLLVLTGVTKFEDLENADILPDFYIPSLGKVDYGLLFNSPTL